jgi:hypothetical protein
VLKLGGAESGELARLPISETCGPFPQELLLHPPHNMAKHRLSVDQEQSAPKRQASYQLDESEKEEEDKWQWDEFVYSGAGETEKLHTGRILFTSGESKIKTPENGKRKTAKGKKASKATDAPAMDTKAETEPAKNPLWIM